MDSNSIDLSWLTTTPIAHRGLYDNQIKIPENSIIAFERAVAAGYAIKLDVHVIIDQEVIVFHDNTLERLCGRHGNVRDLARNDLPLHPLLETDQVIPCLEDVLRLVNGKVPLLIEIKNQQHDKKSNMIILNTLLAYRGKFAILSLDPFVLGWFAEYAPFIPRGQIFSNYELEHSPNTRNNFLKIFISKFLNHPHFIACDIIDQPNNLVKKLRKNGVKAIGWTVTTPQDYEKLSSSFDNIIFEGFNPPNSRNY